MPTLRRILKCTPAGVLGLLVVAWVVSPLGALMTRLAIGNAYYQVSSVRGRIDLVSREIWDGEGFRCYWWRFDDPWSVAEMKGSLRLKIRRHKHGSYPEGSLPWLVVVTGVLPLAIGPFLSFRFRLWHYLAYTSLVAVELAYYLRWQG